MSTTMVLAARAADLGNGRSRLRALLRSPGLALSLATFFWAGSFVVGRALRDDIDPVAITLWRWLLSLLIFAPFVWRDCVERFAVLRREWLLLLGLGATGIALFHPLVYVALQHTSATNALLTFSLTPVVILLWSSLASGRRPVPRELAGVLASMAGAAVLITRGDLASIASIGAHVGDLWMLAAVVVWAAYSMLLRRRPVDLPQTVTLVSSIVMALPMLLAATLMAGAGATLAWSGPVLLGVGYIAVFGSVIGFLFWSHGVAELGASRAGQFVHLMPVFGAALSFVFLGEPLSGAQIVGAVLVLSGIVLIEVGGGR
jgi:drug/metabolite transporter (DMT)-like permease